MWSRKEIKKMYKAAHGQKATCPVCHGETGDDRPFMRVPCCALGMVVVYPPMAPGLRAFVARLGL